MSRTAACYFDIRYEWWPRQKGWFVVIADSAGSGGIAINFCPHCGSKLGGRKKSGRFIEVWNVMANKALHPTGHSTVSLTQASKPVPPAAGLCAEGSGMDDKMKAKLAVVDLFLKR